MLMDECVTEQGALSEAKELLMEVTADMQQGWVQEYLLRTPAEKNWTFLLSSQGLTHSLCCTVRQCAENNHNETDNVGVDWFIATETTEHYVAGLRVNSFAPVGNAKRVLLCEIL